MFVNLRLACLLKGNLSIKINTLRVAAGPITAVATG